MASPGMLQKGLSRSLFLKWCNDKRNGVVFTGYCVENTFARDILNGQRKIRREVGPELNIDCSVDYISFSAHADYRETREFIEKVNPSNVVLVHGEKHEAFRLKKELEKNFGSAIRFNAPFNWQTLKLSFKVTPKVSISESLVTEVIEGEEEDSKINDFSEFNNDVKIEDEEFTAVLIKRNFKYYLMKKKEVEKALGDIFGSLEQKIYVQNNLCIGDLFIIISQIFDNVSLKGEKNQEIVFVENGRILVRKESADCLLVSWMSSFENDTIGDCLAFMLNSIGDFETDLLQPFVKSGAEHVCSSDH
jgi:cleavage and polyadenylation specificity factor subunit 3